MKTNSKGTLAVSTFVAVTLALATVTPAQAAPRRVGPPAGAEGNTAEPELDLAEGAARAEEARAQEATPERWLEEADAKEALGDLEGTQAALEGYLEATAPTEAAGDGADGPAVSDAVARTRSEVKERLADVRERRRGKVQSEPASTHREELDAARAERLGTGKPKAQPPAPVVDKPPKEKIVKKWYFWVTLLAIAGSAGAITGIAISAARDDRKDALDARKPMNPGAPGAVLLRF